MQLLPFLMIELEITAFFERDMLESYLQEFMWKDRFSKSPFDFICSHIILLINMLYVVYDACKIDTIYVNVNISSYKFLLKLHNA